MPRRFCEFGIVPYNPIEAAQYKTRRSYSFQVSHGHPRRPRIRKRRKKAMNLKEKVAIITGAAGGIGATIAVGYAKEGAKL